MVVFNESQVFQAFGVQSLSGTGALRLGAEFLVRVANLDTVYVSNPTWSGTFENVDQ